MKQLKAILLLLTLIGTFAVAAQANKPVTTSSTETAGIDVEVIFANYTALEDDGYENDVYAEVKVYLYGGETYTFDYEITLTLPSGTSYTYLFIITTNIEDLLIYNFFFNHATESGWYTIDVNVLLHTGGQSTDSHTYTFDPPGGSPGSEPDMTIST